MTTNILVVEDSASIRALIVAIIRNLGYTTFEADSGEKALEIFGNESIDLAVLDVELPGISGFETCKKIREIRKKDWIPVIYLSASHSDDYIIKGLDAGGDAYIPKPVNPRLLEAIVTAMGRIAQMKHELADANRELKKLANYDGLTRILNRRGFDDALSRYWRQAQRNNTELSVLLIDVDHFKLFNDSYGHLKGDECLQKVAGTLEKGLLRPIDLVARYGGEEFAALLPETPLTNAPSVATRLLENVQRLEVPHEHSTAAGVVTISIGLASSIHADDAQDLLANADKALYLAKQSGRNQYFVSLL